MKTLLSFRDFVHLAIRRTFKVARPRSKHRRAIHYIMMSLFLRELMRRHGLKRISIIIAINNNFFTQRPLAMLLQISQPSVAYHLQKVKKAWPGMFQTNKLAIPALDEMLDVDRIDEEKIVKKW